MILYQYHTVFCNYFSHRNPNYPSVQNSLAATLAPKSSPKIPFLSLTRWRRRPFPLPAAAPNPNHEQDEKLEENPQENPKEGSGPDLDLLKTIPRKPRRGRKSEAVAVEDFVRSSLEKTFAEIRKQIGGGIPPDGAILKPMNEGKDSQRGRKVEEDEEVEVADVVDSEDPNWPLDSDVGWGIRASEFFDKYPIKNVMDENGVEVDWEGEMVDPLVKEINCLEWESFAFHPSPLMVLVFERYDRVGPSFCRIADNWRAIKELEKAAKVYWNAKDRLPPRTVKIDINIERDLAYALKVRECPQLLFLRGNRIVYREKEIRSAEELVQMIAFFYYKARKPSWVDEKAIAPLY